MNRTIDPRAVVSPEAVIGADVTVGPFAIVEKGAVVGDHSTIDAHSLIACGARIGDGCHIYYGAVVGHAPQDLKYRNEPTTCELGNNTVVREYAVLHRGTGGGGRTIIGSDCFLMAYSHVAHDCVLGDHVILANGVQLAGHVEVEDWAVLGGMTVVHQFAHIGPHVMIGGGSRVSKDVPPFVLAAGEPFRVEGLNSIGLRRRGFSRETLDALDRAYIILYRSGLNVSQAVARLKGETALTAVPEVRRVLDFIGRSTRGLTPAPRALK
jgi:UDP-N-acetylglucosamine acyltransferase